MNARSTLRPVIVSVPEADQRPKGREQVTVLSRLARLALLRSAEASGLAIDSFPKDAAGVPLPVMGIYWSVTHKPSMVAGVAAVEPVGIDLERVRPVSEAVMAKVAGADEWALVDEERQRGFFRIWTAKEAVLKAVGKGMAGLSRCRLVSILDSTRLVLAYDQTHWPVAQCWFRDHVAAVAAQQSAVAWTTIE
jgi:4'-phosphopantetheinyl transferase